MNDRHARSLMSGRYSKTPKLRPGAYFVPRRFFGLSRDDWQVVAGYALGVFNLLLWGHLMTVIFKGLQ